MPEKNVTVSLCMIVKNEAENIVKCLCAIKNYVDEIIVVDTGSTDNTINLAKEHGAQVYNFVWEDNFSAARNFAISMATMDWVLNLDADHIFRLSAGANLKSFLGQTEALGIMIDERTQEPGGGFQSLDRLLLFKNDHNFKYEGMIHEHPLNSIKQYAENHYIKEPYEKTDLFWIEHYGYDDPKSKLNRNIHILKKAVKKEPNNFHYRFKLLLTLKARKGKMEFDTALLSSVYQIEKVNPPLTESIVGIWGLFGDWVIEENNADDVQKFYKGAAELNKKTDWNDIRLVWPYVKVSIIQKEYDKAISDLKRCIRNGIAPSHIALTTIERVAPVVQLIKLVHSYKPAHEFIKIVTHLDEILANSTVQKEFVFKYILESDPALAAEIRAILPEKTVDLIETHTELKDDPSVHDGAQPFISLCMIVKNEQAHLERCLKSARETVDEIIIVDTGSTDNTIEIAKKFRAQILEYNWQGDFADARNYALKHANGRWILHLDADEELDKKSAKNLRNRLFFAKADGINTVLRNYQPNDDMVPYTDEDQVRIFKNNSHYRYQNKIHEQIVPAIAENNGTFQESDILIYHYGYQKDNISRAERNLKILQEELINHPQDAYLLFKMGETYKALKQWKEAEKAFKESLKIPDRRIGSDIKELIYLRLAQVELAMDNHQEAKEYAAGCLRFNSQNAIAKYIMGICMMYSNETEMAMELFKELRSTKNIHKLDLKDVDKLLDVYEMMQSKKTDKILN